MIRRAAKPPSFACLQVIRILNGFVVQIHRHTGITALWVNIDGPHWIHRSPQKRVIIWLSLVFHSKSSFVAFSCPLWYNTREGGRLCSTLR